MDPQIHRKSLLRIISSANSAISDISKLHQNFIDVTSGILANLGYTFRILGEDSTSIIGGLGHAISQIFNSAGHGAGEVVTSLTNGAGNIITSTGGVLKDIIPNSVNIANNILQLD